MEYVAKNYHENCQNAFTPILSTECQNSQSFSHTQVLSIITKTQAKCHLIGVEHVIVRNASEVYGHSPQAKVVTAGLDNQCL